MDLVKSQLDCVNDDHKIWDSMGGEVDISINKKITTSSLTLQFLHYDSILCHISFFRLKRCLGHSKC